jgi:hypothetical protein
LDSGAIPPPIALHLAVHEADASAVPAPAVSPHRVWARPRWDARRRVNGRGVAVGGESVERPKLRRQVPEKLGRLRSKTKMQAEGCELKNSKRVKK